MKLWIVFSCFSLPDERRLLLFSMVHYIYELRYSRMDQEKFVEDSLIKTWSDMICLGRPYHFKVLKAVFHNFYFIGCFSITGFLVTMDIEKAFDSLDHIFLISVLKKFGFGKKLYYLDRNFIKRSTIVCHKW